MSGRLTQRRFIKQAALSLAPVMPAGAWTREQERVLFVSPVGDDGAAGTRVRPLRTPAQAFAMALPG
jgi:hypothetical protein